MSARTLINELKRRHNLKNNRAVATLLGCDESTICLHYRNKLVVGPAFILRVYDTTQLTIEEIREFLT